MASDSGCRNGVGEGMTRDGKKECQQKMRMRPLKYVASLVQMLQSKA